MCSRSDLSDVSGILCLLGRTLIRSCSLCRCESLSVSVVELLRENIYHRGTENSPETLSVVIRSRRPLRLSIF